jgi:hypothetical protein
MGRLCRAAAASYLGMFDGVPRARRDDQDRAAGDARQAVRDAAEERGAKGAATARADHDQLRRLVVREVGEPLRRHTGEHAALRVLEPGCLRDLFEQHLAGAQFGFDVCGPAQRRAEMTGRGVRPARQVGGVPDVREHEPRAEPLRQTGGDCERRVRVRGPVDADDDRSGVHDHSFRRLTLEASRRRKRTAIGSRPYF